MLVTKRELGRSLGVSLVTLDRWLDRFGEAVPCVERGTNGRPYQFDLEATRAFFRARKEEEAEREAERDAELAQLTLPLLPQEEEGGGGKFSLKERADALKLRREERIEAERIGQLVPTDGVREAITEAVAAFNRRLHAKVAVIAAERSLPAEVTKGLRASINEAHRELVDELRHRLRQVRAEVADIQVNSGAGERSDQVQGQGELVAVLDAA